MNRKQTFVIFIFLLIAATLVTACIAQTEAANTESANADEHTDNGGHDDGMDQAHVTPPTAFADLTNPFATDQEAIDAGKVTFTNLCASCHGSGGNGDGPAAAELNPKPAALSDGMMMNELSDGYLFWRVSQGGAMEPFNSAMPAWEGALTEEQRWQVISYVRTLAGDEDGHMEDGHMDDNHEETDGHDN